MPESEIRRRLEDIELMAAGVIGKKVCGYYKDYAKKQNYKCIGNTLKCRAG